MLKGVLFDLDDTLIDWSGFNSDWTAVERGYLSAVFDYITEIHPLNDLDAYCAEFHTRMLAAWTTANTSMRAPNIGTVLMESAVALGVPPDLLDVQRCIEAYKWGVVPGTVTFPDVPDALKLLHQHGIKVGIVTNAQQPMSLRDPEIQAHGLYDFFPDCRISAADVGYVKPHPAIFQAALRRLAIKPEEAVFIGDDLHADIGGAQAMGMRAIWRQPIRNRYYNPADGIVPDATIRSLEAVPAILDEWFPGWRAVEPPVNPDR